MKLGTKADLTFLLGVALGILSLLVLGAGLRGANFPSDGSPWEPGAIFYVAPFACIALLIGAFYLLKRANDTRNIAEQESSKTIHQ